VTLIDRLERHGARSFVLRFCAEQGLPLAEVVGGSRFPHVVRARHRLWFIVWSTLGLSFSEMGRLFGADHATIRRAILKCEQKDAAYLPSAEAAE
jgi:chromosomal replication initiation ATPase DnaA